MKQALGRGTKVHGKVSIVLTDENGREKYREDGENALTDWGRDMLEWYALYGHNNNKYDASANRYPMSPLSDEAERDLAINSFGMTAANSPLGRMLVLLNPVENGLSKHGEHPGWSNAEITGYAVDSIISGKKGAKLTAENIISPYKNKRVYTFPAGCGTGTITDIIRMPSKGVYNPFVGDLIPTNYICDGPSYFLTGKNAMSFANAYFYNYTTNKIYTIYSKSNTAGIIVAVYYYEKNNPDNKYPYFVQLPNVVIPIPNDSWTNSYWRFLFMSDDFALFIFYDGNSKHQFMRYNFKDAVWTCPENGLTNDRIRIPRGYSFTEDASDNLKNYDYIRPVTTDTRHDMPFNITASYDGKYIYSLQILIRHRASPLCGEALLNLLNFACNK